MEADMTTKTRILQILNEDRARAGGYSRRPPFEDVDVAQEGDRLVVILPSDPSGYGISEAAWALAMAGLGVPFAVRNPQGDECGIDARDSRARSYPIPHAQVMLRIERNEVLALLRKLEWAVDADDDPKGGRCPSCRAAREHRPGCELAAMLARAST